MAIRSRFNIRNLRSSRVPFHNSALTSRRRMHEESDRPLPSLRFARPIRTSLRTFCRRPPCAFCQPCQKSHDLWLHRAAGGLHRAHRLRHSQKAPSPTSPDERERENTCSPMTHPSVSRYDKRKYAPKGRIPAFQHYSCVSFSPPHRFRFVFLPILMLPQSGTCQHRNLYFSRRARRHPHRLRQRFFSRIATKTVVRPLVNELLRL